ncbi:hypothetical protein EMN46_05640 [Ancylomarina sp. 16SWW S1-10-2]|nr:hypothetical protein [Ancylomarina sp. 16SWW S1-10-2]
MARKIYPMVPTVYDYSVKDRGKELFPLIDY